MCTNIYRSRGNTLNTHCLGARSVILTCTNWLTFVCKRPPASIVRHELSPRQANIYTSPNVLLCLQWFHTAFRWHCPIERQLKHAAWKIGPSPLLEPVNQCHFQRISLLRLQLCSIRACLSSFPPKFPTEGRSLTSLPRQTSRDVFSRGWLLEYMFETVSSVNQKTIFLRKPLQNTACRRRS